MPRCSPTRPLAEHAPLIPRALAHVAHPAIRTRGTIGGSLANADPAAELPACALALGAAMVLQGPAGTRTIAADAFFTGLFETALAAGRNPDRDRNPVAAGRALGLRRTVPPHRGLRDGRAGRARRTAAHGGWASSPSAPRPSSPATPPRPWRPASPTHTLRRRLRRARRRPAGHADPQASAATRLHLARVLLRRVVGAWAGPAASPHDPPHRERRGRQRQTSPPGCIWPTSCATISASPAPISAASTACAAPAPCGWMAGSCAPAWCSRCRRDGARGGDDRGPVGQRGDRGPASRLRHPQRAAMRLSARRAC